MATYLSEAFKELKDLKENTFDFSFKGIEDLEDFLKGDSIEDIQYIIDPEAKTSEEIKDTYKDKVILKCDSCGSLIYKDSEKVEINKDLGCANSGEECPLCGSTSGYEIVGQIEGLDSTEEEGSTSEEDHLNEISSKIKKSPRKDEKGIEYTYSVYELDEEGDEVDHLADGFVDLEDAIEFAKKQNCPTHIIYIPSEDPDNYKYPDTPDGYDAYEIVWDSKGEYKENLTKEKDSTSEEDQDIDFEEEEELKESVEDHLTKEIIKTPRGGFRLYNGSWGDFNKEEDVDDWGKWFEFYYPEDVEWEDVEKVYYIVHNPLTNHAIAVLRKDKKSSNYLKENHQKISIEDDTDITLVYTDENGKTVVSTEKKEPIEDMEVETEVQINAEPESESELESESKSESEEKEKEEKEKEEVIVPVSDETKEEIEEKSEEEIDFEEFDEEDFNELGESYLKEVYNNVKSYKTTSGKIKGNSILFEGILTFDSGKQVKTSFLFESAYVTKRGKLKFIGENTQITKNKKAFSLNGKVIGNKLILESLTYNYVGKDAKTSESQRLYGTVKKSK